MTPPWTPRVNRTYEEQDILRRLDLKIARHIDEADAIGDAMAEALESGRGHLQHLEDLSGSRRWRGSRYPGPAMRGMLTTDETGHVVL